MISAYTLSTYILSFDDLKIVCVGDLRGRVTRVFSPGCIASDAKLRFAYVCHNCFGS